MIEVGNCIINTLVSSYYNWKSQLQSEQGQPVREQVPIYRSVLYTKKSFSSNEFTDNAVNIYT